MAIDSLCRQELGREPKINELFLFFNTKRDTLKLFWRDGNGSQEIVKALPIPRPSRSAISASDLPKGAFRNFFEHSWKIRPQ